jgi:Zn-dependent protease with chaperone function
MAYLLHIAVALGLIALAQVLDLRVGLPLWGAVALLALPHGLAWSMRRAAFAGRFRALQRLALLFEAAPLLGHAAVHLLFGFGALLGGTGAGVLDGWPGLELLSGLVPFVVLQVLAIDARTRILEPTQNAGQAAFQLRMLLASLVPVTAIFVLVGALGAQRSLRVHLEEVSLLALGAGGVLLVGFALLLPLILRVTWRLRPLPPGPARAAVEPLAASLGIEPRSLYVWDTAGTVANAAVIGFSPRWRQVLFSDVLLAQLGERELRAVLAHEAGHAIARHAIVFGALTLGFFLVSDALLAWIGPRGATGQGLALLVVLGLWYAAFGYLSRRFELQADLIALRATGDPPALCSALEKLVGLHARARRSWRHFSVAERVLFTRAAARDPGVGARLERRLARLRRLGWGLFTLGLVAQVWQGADRWPREQVHVDLRLGRYERAADRLQRLEAPPALVQLVHVGLESAPTGAIADLLGAALAALEAGEGAQARALVELAAWRDAPRLQAVYAALDNMPPELEAATDEGRAALRTALRLALEAAGAARRPA